MWNLAEVSLASDFFTESFVKIEVIVKLMNNLGDDIGNELGVINVGYYNTSMKEARELLKRITK
jgi:hypothetical protein